MMTEQQTAGTGKISASAKKVAAGSKAGQDKPHAPTGVRGSMSVAGSAPIDITDALERVHCGNDDRLRLLIERIERLDEEKKGIGDDIKDVYSEAKATGYDTKTIRRIIKLRKMDPDARREAEALLVIYANSLGLNTQGQLL